MTPRTRGREAAPRGLVGMAVLGSLIFVLPVLALLLRAPWGDLAALWRSDVVVDALRVSLVSSVLATVVVAVQGRALTLSRFSYRFGREITAIAISPSTSRVAVAAGPLLGVIEPPLIADPFFVVGDPRQPNLIDLSFSADGSHLLGTSRLGDTVVFRPAFSHWRRPPTTVRASWPWAAPCCSSPLWAKPSTGASCSSATSPTPSPLSRGSSWRVFSSWRVSSTS